MVKKYQIFISSTYLDLKDVREGVASAISKTNHIAVGMELFGATTQSQWELIKELIDNSDYYILIIGGRYGSIAPVLPGEEEKEMSYTQKEYEYAYTRKIPIYTFFRSDIASLPVDKKEKTEKGRKKLEKFIKLIKNNGYYHEHWHDTYELCGNVVTALNKNFLSHPRAGWIRSDRLVEIANDYNSDVEIKEKLIYYKFIHLSDKIENSNSIYTKFIKRLNKSVEVYDEFITFRITCFSKLLKRFRSYDSTKGDAVEVNSFLPFVMNLRDTDKTAESNPQIIQPIIQGPSNVFITSSHYYNGFQKGNRDTAIKMDKNSELTRIVVDFTSIKNYKSFISQEPIIFFSCYDVDKGGKFVSMNIGAAEIIAPGVFSAKKENMKEGEVLRIEFDTDFETISNISK